MPGKDHLQQAVPIQFFACEWEKIYEETLLQRPCDTWVLNWPQVDPELLFGANYSPLSRGYYNQIVTALSLAASQSYIQCNERHYASQQEPEPGLRIAVSSRLNRGGVTRGSTERRGIEARVSVPFAGGAALPPPPPTPCPLLQRELFVRSVDFGYVLHGPANGNFRWEWDGQAAPADPYFDLYGRTLGFYSSGSTQTIGTLRLLLDKVVDLWVIFESRPIPSSVTDRVDPEQPLSYQVSTGGGYFGIAAVIEVTHLESGQIWHRSIHGTNYPPTQMTPYTRWPSGWEQMSMDADGIIRHHNVDFTYFVYQIDPASVGLPAIGTYRMRYILLAYGYQTFNRWVTSDATGTSGGARMSLAPIQFSHMPSLISYTPGLSEGIIPPFVMTYTRSPVLADGIEFDAAFDLKNLTTFRFVVKVGNTFDFAIGLVVTAAGLHAWVRLEPGETKYLAGAISISGMTNAPAYFLHPEWDNSGWLFNTGGNYLWTYNGQLYVDFKLFLTAPNNPETTPANVPALKTGLRWIWSITDWTAQSEPEWIAIKRYMSDGRYGYEHELQLRYVGEDAIIGINRSITKPSYQPLINPETFFVTGYKTSPLDYVSPWHKRPWPTYSGWPSRTVPIMINGEKRTWNGSEYVWESVTAEPISLTRPMLQQVAAMLDVVEYVVMDGDDIRWFVPVAYNPPEYPETFTNVLWIDRFYTQNGALVDEAAMRSAFQAVIDANADSWPDYRNIVIHPAVRFGSFLDNGGFEVGEYLLGPTGSLIEVGGLDDLATVSTRFLYYINPEFR
ncbi:hypothetical protein [Sulfurivermis fontis]|uniref:hypothetical protein n=1 Tax=Sulfurivermis fontis TaxID=1972068 RepID=UPI000FD91B2E|nr:hypothetical protein [Sulfurivermis fontis]